MAEEHPPTTPARPRPEYGEYAPEGWNWKPEGATEQAADPAAPTDRPSSGPVPGVPHNLGSRPEGGVPTPGVPAADAAADAPTLQSDSRPGEPAPYRAAEPPASYTPAPAGRPVAGGSRRLGDRIITIVLLVLGALGALYFAATLYQLPASFSMMATALELDGFVVPASLNTLSLVGSLAVFAIYAVNLIYSIQRLRHGKLTFWVPLVAGVIALIVVFVFSAFAVNQVPELMREMADPDALNKMLDYMSTMGTS